MRVSSGSITDISGILAGHAQNFEGATGCSVVLCKEGATTGVACTGGSPGTRELSALNPENSVPIAHAVYLGGGSAFGLAGADGVMKFLEEQGIGFDVGVAQVPIVPGAILFDLAIGDPHCRPDAKMGYEACRNAASSATEMGSIGAGTGATIGFKGSKGTLMKGGLGTASAQSGNLIVGAMVAVNSMGDVVDPKTGEILAGVYDRETKEFPGISSFLTSNPTDKNPKFLRNTTIGVVATNAVLTKAEAKRIAIMAHDGYARTIVPAHTLSDGDTIFCMATGSLEADLDAVGILAVEAVSNAILNAVCSASAIDGIFSYTDIKGRS